jgi:hypothetical protein
MPFPDSLPNPRRVWLGVFAALASAGALSACTTTPEPQQPDPLASLPEEFLKEENTKTYGVIEEDHAQYEWTSREFEDGRFANELDNSPLSASQSDYQPITGEPERPKMTQASKDARKVKMTKASKASKLKKRKSK